MAPAKIAPGDYIIAPMNTEVKTQLATYITLEPADLASMATRQGIPLSSSPSSQSQLFLEDVTRM